MKDNNLRNESQTPPRCRPTARLLAAAVTVAALALLTVAACLHPDAAGLGTHQQLNLPPCGFYERTGYPCPTCGMTTSFALTVRGRLIQAFATQPAGTTAALAVMIVAAIAGYVAATGRSIEKLIFRINYNALLITAAAIIIAAWLYLCALTRMGLR